MKNKKQSKPKLIDILYLYHFYIRQDNKYWNQARDGIFLASLYSALKSDEKMKKKRMQDKIDKSFQ